MIGPREPTIEIHGPFATHDQQCAVMEGESAVFNMELGVFAPSWKAQADGWHLVQAKTWLQRLALRVLMPNACELTEAKETEDATRECAPAARP